jgi:hypothetical protein
MKKQAKGLLAKPRKLWTAEETAVFEYINQPEIKDRLKLLN